MKILLVYKDYYPVLGGIEHHVQLLAEGLRERGIDARVLVTNTSSQTVCESINRVPVTKTGRLANISSAPISPAFFRSLAELSRDTDVTHLHFPYPPAEIGQLLFGRGRHFVLTYHSDIVRQQVLGLLYRPLLWRVLRKAERIAVSNLQYIQTSRFLRPFASKCAVIHFGVDLSRFDPTAEIDRRAAEIRMEWPGRPLILAVGKLRHYKGIDVLIQAMRQLGPACALVVGSGPMAPAWQRLAVETGVSDRVQFLGEVSERELVALYRAADVFVLPSTNRAETWGTVQVEAMASGLAVVCTELGTGTSYVNQDGETGLVVPPRDPAALAVALRRLIDDPALRRKMGAAGRARAVDQFSKTAMIDKTLSFYQQVVETRPPA